MFRICISVCIFFSLCGCVANNGLGSMASSEVNIYNMSRLSAGMNQSEVLQVMKKPYKYEKFEIQDDIYDVWFYVTRSTVLGQSRMVPQNLSPLTFKNGVLVGWGFAYYNYLVKKEEALQAPKKVSPLKKVEEDEALEKALQVPAGSKAPVIPTQPVNPASLPPVEKEQPKPNPPAKTTTPPTAPSKAGSKVSGEKTQPLKIEPSHNDTMEKSQFHNPDQLKGSKFSPPDKPQPQAPAKPEGPKKPSGNTKPLSMSSKPKNTSSEPQPKSPEKSKKSAEKKPLMDEKDQDMLEEASDQNFNQT